MTGEGRAEREANAQRRKVPPEVLDAAVALVNSLAANATFRAQIAEDEIAQRIEDGSLIPIERLLVAPGLELIPAGRHADLERAAKRVVKAWLDIPGEQGWTEEEVVLSRAVKGLAALFDVYDVESDPDADITGTDDTPEGDAIELDEQQHVTDAANPTDDEEPTSTSAPTDEGADHEEPPVANRDSSPSDEEEKPAFDQVEAGTPTGRPEGMPDGDDHGPCEECGESIDEPDQARVSWILTRRKLCRPCHVGETPAAQPEEDTDGAPGDA